MNVLSRIQFALTVSFHFLFPPMTIGLGAMLVVMQALRDLLRVSRQRDADGGVVLTMRAPEAS